MNLNFWSLILLFGSLQAFLLFLVFISRTKGHLVSHRIFALLMFFFSIMLFDQSLRLSDLYKSFPQFLYISMGQWFLLGPLIWLYLKTRIGNRGLRWWDIFHYIPTMIILYLWGEIAIAAPAIKVQVLERFISSGSVFSGTGRLVLLANMIQITCYMVASMVLLVRYEKQFRENASGNELNNLIQIKRIVIGACIYFFMEFTVSTYRNFSGIQNEFIQNWSLVAWTFFLLGLGYAIMANPNEVFREFRTHKSPYSQGKLGELKQKLEEVMQTEKLYLKRDLDLQSLALALDSNPHQVSFLLNKEMNTSFYDYVNTRRVRHVAEEFKIGKHKSLSIFGIAESCGFKSKGSFYSFFKQEFRKTPKEYLKEKRDWD